MLTKDNKMLCCNKRNRTGRNLADNFISAFAIVNYDGSITPYVKMPNIGYILTSHSVNDRHFNLLGWTIPFRERGY